MNLREFFLAIRKETSTDRFSAILEGLEAGQSDLKWRPVGDKQNNQGPINVATDPGRSLIERITNAVDAILEAEHDEHKGTPRCRTPKEAAIAWLGVPELGLSKLTPQQRRMLAQRVVVHVQSGDGVKESRVVEIVDRGIGLLPAEMPSTILSLNESNKIQKHYVAGVYGQGGSSTFACSKFTVVASRRSASPVVGFTVVRFNDLPPDEYKVGNYVYLTLAGGVLELEVDEKDFPTGTAIRHIGYDLTKYPSPLGPNSLYGLLNEILFDPILPVFLDNEALTTRQRRTIVGSRNSLNGASEDDDDSRRGTAIVHNVGLYYSTLADFGSLGLEYWVLDRPTKENKKPAAAFVNPAKPIILTHNGQNHAELSATILRKDCELPFLSQRLICHVNCDNLTAGAKRSLFSSTREDVRTGAVFELIRQEVIRVLKSDDTLKQLNNEARDLGRDEEDQTAEQQLRVEVAKILRSYGLEMMENIGSQPTTVKGGRDGRPSPTVRSRKPPKEIEIREPPTFVRIVWDEEDHIPFYSEQRRYIRIETDANGNYHNALKRDLSRLNIFTMGEHVRFCGSTPLNGGRLRGIFECITNPTVGESGTIRVELTRPGLPMLTDERPYKIVQVPEVDTPQKKAAVPPFKLIPVKDIDDQRWSELAWPEDVSKVASSASMSDGILEVYYSEVYPGYRDRLKRLEAREPGLSKSFSQRYGIWLAVHSLLFHQDSDKGDTGPQAVTPPPSPADGSETSQSEEVSEQRERCRIATIAAIFAMREVTQKSSENADD